MKFASKEKNKITKLPMDAAGDILGRRAYSSHDLADKLLEKGYTEKEVAETIASLLEYGYLDDADYARRFVEQAVRNGKGNGYIRNKLALSGIPKDLIPEPEGEFERAMEVANKMPGKTPEQIGRRLASRGFAITTVYKVMSNLDKSR